jgi:23S rRNA (adenine2030-N6)-methyltransferase
MLSYQHAYHAGSAADVHKHVALTLLLRHLAAKPKPFSVVDTHAGEGLYDLGAPMAAKLAEHQAGIGRLWERSDPSAEVAGYLDLVRRLNPGRSLTHYPGSPALALAHMRQKDRLVLNEKHPAAYRALRRWAGEDKRIHLHRRDGLEALTALVPPAIRRGLVVVDPSYEVKEEYTTVPEALARAVAKWPLGVYAIWYPVLEAGRHRELINAIGKIDAPSVLAEMTLGAASGLRGSGLIVINPPWQFAEEMEAAGAYLAKVFGSGKGAKATLRWFNQPAA